MLNPLFHNIPPAVKSIYFLLMTLFTGAFLVFLGMIFISWMSGTDMDAIEQVMGEPDNPSFLSILRILTTLNQIGAFLLASWLFLWIFGKDSVEGLYFRKFDPKLWLIVPLAMLSASPIIDFFMRLNYWIIPEGSWIESVFKPMEDNGTEITEALLAMDNPWTLALNLILIAILPAVGEELAFRGILQNQIAKSTRNIHTAVWISAFIFSAYHMQFYGFIPRMLLGAFFGYLMIWTGSIWPSIFAHLINNTSAVIAMYFAQITPTGGEAALSNPDTPPNYLFLAVGVLVFGIAVILMIKQSVWPRISESYLHWERMDIWPDLDSDS